MSGHNVLHNLYKAPFVVAHSTASGTLNVDRYGVVFAVTTATAEARTLAQPTKAGLLCTVVLDTTAGNLTLTVTGGYNADGDTSITFADAGDFVTFLSIKVGTSYYWRAIAQEGTNVALETFAVDVLTATEVVATNVNATTGRITEVVATNVNATNVKPTLCAATNVTATNINATNNMKCAILNATTSVNTAECVATNVNATNVTATLVAATNVNATNVNPTLCAATNVTATNINATLGTFTNVAVTNVNASGEVLATNVNVTNANATLVAATNVNATNATLTSTVNAVEVLATNVNATTGNITEVVGTNVNATTGTITEVVATNVNATTVTATTLVASTGLNTNGIDVTANTVGFFQQTAAAQPSGIANTNNNVDTLATTLNSVIAALETLGLLATV